MKMLHHPYCTKSVAALDFVVKNNLPVEVVDLTKEKPDAEFLRGLLQKLGIPAFELVRTSEPIYQKKYADKTLTDEQWIDTLVAHPVLLQRPIFIAGDQAVIGRPVERIYEILK